MEAAARLRLDELKAAEGVRLWRSAMAAALLKEAVRLRRGEMAAVVRLQEREAVRLRHSVAEQILLAGVARSAPGLL